MPNLRATSREREEYATATELARATRSNVADQMRELIVEGDRMGSRDEVAARLRDMLGAERRIMEAKGRQQQAQEEGLPRTEHWHAEEEGRETLRSAVMALGAACGAWVAALDHERVGAGVQVSIDPAPPV